MVIKSISDAIGLATMANEPLHVLDLLAATSVHSKHTTHTAWLPLTLG